MMYEYIFIKPYEAEGGVIPEGSNLREFRGFLYLNGGLVSPVYAVELRELIEDEDLRKEYLDKRLVIANKV